MLLIASSNSSTITSSLLFLPVSFPSLQAPVAEENKTVHPGCVPPAWKVDTGGVIAVYAPPFPIAPREPALPSTSLERLLHPPIGWALAICGYSISFAFYFLGYLSHIQVLWSAL